MKTLEEIKAIYNAEVESRVQKEGLSIGHSRWSIKDDVLDFLVETEFDGGLPTDDKTLNWFECECGIVETYLATENF